MSQPLTTAQTMVPHCMPINFPKKHSDKITPSAQLQQSYIVFVLLMVMLNFVENSFTNSSYASGGKYVWNKSATPTAQMNKPAVYSVICHMIPSKENHATTPIVASSMIPYRKAVAKDKK